MRSPILGICGVTFVILAVATPARAADNSFDGSCDGQGKATFDKPVTGTPEDNVMHTRSTGTCSGTLNGMSVNNAPIEDRTDGPFNGSCYGAHSTAPAPGLLKFTRGTADSDDDVVIRYRLTWTADTLNGTNFQLEGEKSGEGAGHSEVPTEDVSAFFSQCEGDGVSEVRFTAQSWTYSPLVSEDLPTSGGVPSTVSPRLLLGPTRGMRSARPGHPFRVRVRALGGLLRGTRVVVRDSLGRSVGRSRRFSLGVTRKRVRVWVNRRLGAGRYRIAAAGRDADGRRVRAVRSVRLRRRR